MAAGNKRWREYVGTVLVYAFLIGFGFIMLVPFLWMLDTAFKHSGQVYHIPIQWWPRPIDWLNWVKTWTGAPFARFYLNSFIVAVVSTAAQVFTSILAGYAFARMRFPGRRVLFLLVLSTLMIPFQVIMIPVYLIVRDLGLINHLAALIVPNLATGFGIFLLRQYFLQLPVELEEAAVIDGASRARVIWRIMVPLARPALATLTLLSFLGSWNAYLWPLIAINVPSRMTVQAGLAFFQGVHVSQFNRLMAGSLISIIPVVILFFFTQKQLIEGIVAGSVKG